MNMLRKIGLVSVAVGLYSSSVMAVDFDGRAIATVITPLVIAETTPITFGTLGTGTTGGTVILATDDSRTVTGDVNIIGADGLAGVYTITGENAQAYTMSIADGVLSDGGVNTMGVGTYVYSPPALTGAAVAFDIGATLTVNGSQPAGSYSTAFAGGTPVVITANYN